jgi:DNA-directed RNA polymerase specialized sigma24 family protein
MTPSTRGFWWGFQSRAVPLAASARVVPPDPTDWPSLWARCWSRIRSWQVPPRWSHHEWLEEARAQGALAACEAIRAFEPARLVPLDAFLYRRVVESVWTRYRQECRFGRRCRLDASLSDYTATEPGRPDPELLDRLAEVLQTLDEGERRLIRQIFWDARSEDDLARELGLTRQAVNKRKQKVLRRLRSDLMIEEISRA